MTFSSFSALCVRLCGKYGCTGIVIVPSRPVKEKKKKGREEKKEEALSRFKVDTISKRSILRRTPPKKSPKKSVGKIEERWKKWKEPQITTDRRALGLDFDETVFGLVRGLGGGDARSPGIISHSSAGTKVLGKKEREKKKIFFLFFGGFFFFHVSSFFFFFFSCSIGLVVIF